MLSKIYKWTLFCPQIKLNILNRVMIFLLNMAKFITILFIAIIIYYCNTLLLFRKLWRDTIASYDENLLACTWWKRLGFVVVRVKLKFSVLRLESLWRTVSETEYLYWVSLPKITAEKKKGRGNWTFPWHLKY